MRSVLRLLALVLVAACTAPEPGLRDVSAPFGATTRFDPAAFAGTWYEVARFREGPVARRDYAYDGGRITSGGEAYTVAAPGRMRAADGSETWVLWADEGHRTAVLGQPDGAETVILDRAKVPAADRLAAARAILEWYGYDMTQFRMAK